MADTPTVDVPIPVDPATAEILADPETRAEMGRRIARHLRGTAVARALREALVEGEESGPAEPIDIERFLDDRRGAIAR